MDVSRIWTEETASGATTVPLLATAIHDGHQIRDDLLKHLALGDAERLREEDPFTAEWVTVAPRRIVGRASRFQVDLNRPRESAVYRTPADAWGLRVWKSELPDACLQRSLREYDTYYSSLHETLRAMVEKFGRCVVYDLHTYNHRRDGPDAPPADPAANPQVNIGTGTMKRERWGSVIDRFIDDLGSHDFPTGPLDVRENVKFRGGNQARWIHAQFPESVCVIAIEFKKFFMDEWTGEPDRAQVEAIHSALVATTAGVLEALGESSS